MKKARLPSTQAGICLESKLSPSELLPRTVTLPVPGTLSVGPLHKLEMPQPLKTSCQCTSDRPIIKSSPTKAETDAAEAEPGRLSEHRISDSDECCTGPSPEHVRRGFA
jgi:hypothetical protein